MVDDKTIRRTTKDLSSNSNVEEETRKANFVVLAGQDIGRKYDIEKSEIYIGRNETCEIYIDDEDVSRVHAKVISEPESVYIQDLGSTNGTLVNGEKVQRHKLQDGDRVQVGNLTVLKFNFVDEIEDSFNEQLYNAANKDYLTQIYNKKYFLDRLKMEFSYSKRHNTPLSLMLFDLDYFKKINDTYGHLAGDQILKQFANEINFIKRHEDLFARYGGEEFVLLLRGTDQEAAAAIAEKIRKRIEEHAFKVDKKEVSMTTSIGIGCFEQNNMEDYQQLLNVTDQLLYRAKEQGRNQVQFNKSEKTGKSNTKKLNLVS